MNIRGKPETILVVDDDPLVLAVVVLILQRSNFNVLFACDGADAVELAEATGEKIDLLLSDIDMPLMSGPASGEALKQARPDMRVMFMSVERMEIYSFSTTAGPL